MNRDYLIKELVTKRLILKKGKEKDYLSVYEYDFTKLKDFDGMIEYAEQDVKSIKKSFKKGEDYFFKVCEKNHMFDWIIYLNDTPIGNILADRENLKENKIEITINIHPNYWNKGYATEAIDAVIDFLVEKSYDKIIIRYLEGDTKVKHISEKLGFKPYDITYDAIIFEKNYLDEYQVIMLKDEWLSKTGKINIVDKVLL